MLQYGGYEIFGHIRDIIWEVDVAIVDIFVSFFVILSFEWGFSSQELEGQDSDAPNIDCVVILRMVHHLWWKVIKRPAHGLPLIFGAVDAPPEVRKLDGSSAI